ncbi:MAG: DUF4358 domain-containing protein [Lawsonibacter sp.]|nr:DUF4358 domain-containing protein [Lawsonibacter sp.]
MKKWIIFCLSALLALSLAACGGKETGAAWTEDSLQAFLDSGAFSEELEELDADILWPLYRLEDAGLSREQLDSARAFRSAGATCEEVAVLSFTDEKAAELAAGALKDYTAAQIDANRSYRPDEIPKLENARIDRRGSTLLLLVAADQDAAAQLLK